MRQHHRVALGMRQIERPAQRVAQLVVQRHAHAAHHDAAQPRAIKSIGAGRQVSGLLADGRQGAAQGGDAFAGHETDHRVAVRRIQALGRMRNCIDAAGHAHVHRQTQRELRVVNHAARHHPHVFAGFLHAVLGDAIDRRHFRAGVSGWNGNDGQAGVQRNRFAQAGGRAAANRHGAISAQLPGDLSGLAGGLYRHMHHRAVKHTGRARTQQVGHHLGRVALLWRGQDQRALETQRINFALQMLYGTRTKNHTGRVCGVDERSDGRHVRFSLVQFGLKACQAPDRARWPGRHCAPVL